MDASKQIDLVLLALSKKLRMRKTEITKELLDGFLALLAEKRKPADERIKSLEDRVNELVTELDHLDHYIRHDLTGNLVGSGYPSVSAAG